MDPTPTLMRPPENAERPSHRRTKSSSVLKSIMVTKNHKRSPSNGTALGTQNYENTRPYDLRNGSKAARLPMLPPDHPHGAQSVLGEIQYGANPISPRKSRESREERPKGLHKKALSSVSLRSLGRDKDKDKETKEARRAREAKSERQKKPQKIKSSTSLAAIFGKATSTQEERGETKQHKDKENTTPPQSAVAELRTPIWAEFSSQRYEEVTTTSSIPLNDRRDVEDEIALYTPKDYSPSKQRNFFDYGQPSLQRRVIPTHKSKGSQLPSSTSAASLVETFARKISGDRERPSATKLADARKSIDEQRLKMSSGRSLFRRVSLERKVNDQSTNDLSVAKRGSRVMATIAALQGKAKDKEAEVEKETMLDPKVVDSQFEAMLESMNVAQNLRPSMRSLTTTVKANMLRGHSINMNASPTKEDGTLREGTRTKRGTFGRKGKSGDRKSEDEEEVLSSADGSTSRSTRSRSRSKTFTFSRGDSPKKKQTSGVDATIPRSSKSIDLPRSPSSRSLPLLENNGGSSFHRSSKPSTAEDFVTYLRKTKKPQDVEVGKLHKLRLLLRNETVAWVDSFISLGGMTEIVGLLHRLMEIEWRDDHDDKVIHEALLCLKGLCTTDVALQKLCEIEQTLFPALLGMLFDKESKGPSEHNTRGLIISLLFAHLSAASPSELPSRARRILDLLKDPVEEKEANALPFVLQMHTPRPYRVWCREVTNTTKEVFWIFLHDHIVVPLPSDSELKTAEYLPYAAAHFPKPRPPVPAAPYTSSIEWDATNYMATHLDLLNGLIASLLTREERNALRTELRDSGFEKLMGSQLRRCKEKFYGSVHDGLRTWVRAAVADEWEVKPVRMGKREDGALLSPAKSPNKSPKKMEKPPQLDVPKIVLPSLDLGLGEANNSGEGAVDDWV